MPLTVVARNRMLKIATGYFERIYLVQDTLNNASLDLSLANVNVSVRSYGGAKSLIWPADATDGTISTTNVATSQVLNNIAGLTPSTAINFDVTQSATLTRFLLTDDNATEGSRKIYGRISVKSPIPTYTSAQGAYFFRGLTLTMSEV